MFRRPGPKPPLAQVASLVDAAMTIVEAYWRDETFQPTASDLELLGRLKMNLQRTHTRMGRLAFRLQCRFRGEPEVNRHTWDW
jgi:hypothetical protein